MPPDPGALEEQVRLVIHPDLEILAHGVIAFRLFIDDTVRIHSGTETVPSGVVDSEAGVTGTYIHALPSAESSSGVSHHGIRGGIRDFHCPVTIVGYVTSIIANAGRKGPITVIGSDGTHHKVRFLILGVIILILAVIVGIVAVVIGKGTIPVAVLVPSIGGIVVAVITCDIPCGTDIGTGVIIGAIVGAIGAGVIPGRAIIRVAARIGVTIAILIRWIAIIGAASTTIGSIGTVIIGSIAVPPVTVVGVITIAVVVTIVVVHWGLQSGGVSGRIDDAYRLCQFVVGFDSLKPSVLQDRSGRDVIHSGCRDSELIDRCHFKLMTVIRFQHNGGDRGDHRPAGYSHGENHRILRIGESSTQVTHSRIHKSSLLVNIRNGNVGKIPENRIERRRESAIQETPHKREKREYFSNDTHILVVIGNNQ